MQRYALAVAIVVEALLIPTTAGTQTEPVVVHVTIPEQPAPIVNVTVPELEAPVVNVTVPDQQPIVNVTVPEQPAPVVNVTQPERTVEVEVEVERIVEVRTCLDFAELPHFDLANALTAAFPGALWGLSGSHYNGLTWRDDSPKPDMAAIIGGWLTHLESQCDM